MKPDEVFAELKRIAPHVAFETSREADPDATWDGAGPDPQLEGYDPYVVTVRCFIIHSGDVLDSEAHLSSSYYQHDEPIGDLHGYLLHKLQEAVRGVMSLDEVLPRDAIYAELQAADDFLTRQMKKEYDEYLATRN